MAIRDEAPQDAAAVATLHRAAFGGDDEAALVGRLHRQGDVAIALVAEVAGEVVGHLLLSHLPTEIDSRAVRALALAPVAVLPARQRQGIGSRLVLAGIDAARATNAEAIIVLGHPAWYPRFGFAAVLAAKLISPFSGEAFMALELLPGALAGQAGRVDYPVAFGI